MSVGLTYGGVMAFSESGKGRRMARLFRHADGRAVILPIDEGVISGPRSQIADLPAFFDAIGSNPPDGLLLFAGVLVRHWPALGAMAAIVNLTASTNGPAHVHKVLCTDVETAVAAGADIVAVHVNVTGRHDGEMIKTLGTVVRRAETVGVPVLAIMYPRREADGGDDDYLEMRKADPGRYSQLVSHSARIGMELGADVIKTQYTGSPETFATVIEATRPVPVVVAGGPAGSEAEVLSTATGAILAGARGVSFGRNVFEREDPARMLRLLDEAVHSTVLPRP